MNNINASSKFLVIMQRNRDTEELRLSSMRPEEPSMIVTKESIEIRKKGYSISARFVHCRSGELYTEMANGKCTGSFVLVFGWCYSVTNDSSSLSQPDLASILLQHRTEALPHWLFGSKLSGQFCILSFDHISQSLWCTCDIWAQQGFFFGADSSLIAASSHAGSIANLIKSQVNGIAYINILRSSNLLPGQTLFTNVHRITCGKSIKFEFSRQIAWVVKTSEIVKDIESMSFQQSVDRAIDVISSVCLRAAKLPRMAIDLTGGNDTRLNAAVIATKCEFNHISRFTFKVHQTETHPDAIIAKRVANQFGWKLRRNERGYDISHESVNLLLQIAPISDGNRFPSILAEAILNNEACWPDCDYLWGSLGGEFMRDFFWRHEIPFIGLTDKVNYQSLLHNRLYASSKIDIERISDSRLSLADHNEYILDAYRSIGELNPYQKNVYKLDRIYLYKLMSKADNWEYSAQRTKVLPYLTSEVLDVSLSTPWIHRIGRRLVKAIIMRLQPSLTRIPHDTGAPMGPLNFSNILDYMVFSYKYIYDRYSKHFGPRSQVSRPNIIVNAPKHWLIWAINNRCGSSIGNSEHLLKRAATGSLLSIEEEREIEMLLLLRALKEKYPGLIEELNFDYTNMMDIKTNCQL